jgi:hypothetical protein
MKKYRIYLTATVSGTMDVEVPDEITDPDEISEWAMAHGREPSLGPQVSGWGQPWSLELSAWEPETSDGFAMVTDLDSTRITRKEEA